MSTSITKLAEKYDGALTKIKRMREQGEIVATRGMRTVLIVGGGAAAGVMNGMWGKGGEPAKVGSTKVDADLAIGVAAVAAAVTGIAGKGSDQALDFGAGLLAVATARHVERATSEYHAKHP